MHLFNRKELKDLLEPDLNPISLHDRDKFFIAIIIDLNEVIQLPIVIQPMEKTKLLTYFRVIVA